MACVPQYRYDNNLYLLGSVLFSCRNHIHIEQLHFFGILHFAPKMPLLQQWFQDERTGKLEASQLFLLKVKGQHLTAGKKEKKNVRIVGIGSYFKCLHRKQKPQKISWENSHGTVTQYQLIHNLFSKQKHSFVKSLYIFAI